MCYVIGAIKPIGRSMFLSISLLLNILSKNVIIKNIPNEHKSGNAPKKRP